MSLGMEKRKVRVVLDTNIIFSAIISAGKPREILELVLREKLIGVTSDVLVSELLEILSKKFGYTDNQLEEVKEAVKEAFAWVSPGNELNTVRDRDDNRVIEAAVAGRCDYIVTGDKDLLVLRQYKSIKIVKPKDFVCINLQLR